MRTYEEMCEIKKDFQKTAKQLRSSGLFDGKVYMNEQQLRKSTATIRVGFVWAGESFDSIESKGDAIREMFKDFALRNGAIFTNEVKPRYSNVTECYIRLHF